MNLQALSISDIPFGQPLPWQIYDHEHKPLFPRGEVIASREEIETLAADGLFRDRHAPAAANGAPQMEYRVLQAHEIFPPDGIKPQIGERVQLRLLSRNNQSYFTARLIGYLRDTSILLSAPTSGNMRVDIADGEAVECRMLNGSNIYVFESEVVRVCTSPAHYLHLQYPKTLRIQKLRKAPRARVRLAATPVDASGKPYSAQILDLSPDGCLMACANNLGKDGSKLQISFAAVVDELQCTLQLEAVIQHVRAAAAKPGERPESLEYGIAFIKSSNEDRLWLKSLVYLHIAEGYLA